MPVPRVVPSQDQKTEGVMLAFKDSVKKLTGVSFNPIKHENGAPNQVIGNHFTDLNQHAALMLPYMQRCG
jgi:hypothetical protein